MKSAVREIKRDNEFLARRKIQEQIDRFLKRITSLLSFFPPSPPYKITLRILTLPTEMTRGKPR